jgi:hypothetical protein
MHDVEIQNVDLLVRDLKLRGWRDADLSRLLKTPVLLIPGPITPMDSESPLQELTKHVAFISKDLSAKGIENKVVLREDLSRVYVEERDAHVDLGAIILMSLTQLGGLANLAQILDFLLNLIQLRFILRRTQELTPTAKFDLHICNGERAVKWHIEAPANELTRMSTPERIKAIVKALENTSKNDD